MSEGRRLDRQRPLRCADRTQAKRAGTDREIRAVGVNGNFLSLQRQDIASLLPGIAHGTILRGE